ncbi:MAG: GNAT family N-acetyltransferase, partial [Planctomycetaceae bacterium]|nr:GNAT family N-acetyltransferase [Planctomycetaceae bacterium]
SARLAEFEFLNFEMSSKKDAELVGMISLYGLDFYMKCWNHRAVGLRDLKISEAFQRQGMAQALLIEIGKQLKQEMITLLEMHTPLENTALIQLITGAGFTQVDEGVVYRKSIS